MKPYDGAQVITERFYDYENDIWQWQQISFAVWDIFDCQYPHPNL